jgi:acyl-CoA reductase-like NAD-dependent aldehyde dehydrogenase
MDRPSSTAKIRVINSATEELFLTVAEAQEADVNRAVEAARKAFDRGPWPRMTPTERAGFMKSMAAELNKLAEPHARIWTTEAGALHSFTKMRTAGISGDYLSYAALADTFPFQERHKPKAGRCWCVSRSALSLRSCPGTRHPARLRARSARR